MGKVQCVIKMEMNAEFFVVFGGGGRRGGIQYVIFPLQHYAKPKPFEQHARFHISVLFPFL